MRKQPRRRSKSSLARSVKKLYFEDAEKAGNRIGLDAKRIFTAALQHGSPESGLDKLCTGLFTLIVAARNEAEHEAASQRRHKTKPSRPRGHSMKQELSN